jgi:DNA-binding transcriptional LysR family regulator
MDQFDLNLLRTLDALWRHRHLGRAAEELGVSQPALSHSLKRLREQIGDPLFVKTQSGMQPSARAVELAPVVQALLTAVREQVLVAPEFDASVSTRTFTLAMSDIGEMTFLPALLAELMVLAPGVDVITVMRPPRDLSGSLQRSEVDLVVGFFPDLDGTDVFQQRLFSHGFACLVSSSSPMAKATLTPEKFIELPHAVVHTESRTHDIVEQYLREHGIRRRQVLRCPHFLGIPHVIAATNLVATVSESISQVLAGNPQLAVKEAPYPFPRYDVKQYWHRCQHEDPGNRWLRGLVLRLFGRAQR